MSITSTINTILIIGATSGLGEAFARRLHAQGKTVILTGRRTSRLSAIKASLLTNVHTYTWDITSLSTLSSTASQILQDHPSINAVFVMAGFGSFFNFLDHEASTDEKIIAECTTNVTAQMLLTRAFMPYLASLAANGTPATYFLMGSGMGFAPNGSFPIYCSTKACTHSLAVSLRQTVLRSPDPSIVQNLNVVEVVAPYVATDFDAGFRGDGERNGAMELDEFMDEAMRQLDGVGDGGEGNGMGKLREVKVGTAVKRVDVWRESVGRYLMDVGMDG